jgi:cytochrome c oxidase subunit 2
MGSGLKKLLLAPVLLCLGGIAGAEDELPIPADEFIYCSTCHGVQLMGNPILRAPRLSGMDAWYVEQQLHGYKDGWRGKDEKDPAGMDMQPMAAALSDQQIIDVAEYVALTRSPMPATTVAGDVDKGRALYASCRACHGQSGEGVESLGGPALTGIDDWYFITQMKNFRDGIRGSHPDDNYGRLMQNATRSLSDDDAIVDIVSYISTLHQ